MGSDLNSPPLSALTQREQQIAALICGGLANKIIARELSVSEGTVKTHIHSIFRKLHIRNRVALVIALSGREGL
jgi:two-component system, NarL family, nitrate/nitrite response regulator NarL